MLDDALRLRLVNLVAQGIGWPVNTSTITLLLGHEALSRPQPSSSPGLYAQWVVGYAMRSRTPKCFITIVRRLAGGSEVELQALATHFEDEPSSWSAPGADPLWVPERWPFLDRHNIRQRLAELADGVGPPAMAIQAPAGHGKKTVCRYIEQLARDRQTFLPVIAELRVQPQVGALGLVVDSLRNALGLDPDFGTTHEEPQRHAEVLASNLALDAIAKATTPVWFVPNIVRPDGLEEGLLPFVDDLLKLVHRSPALANTLRMVVMADGLTALGLENLPPPEARHSLQEVTETEISNWLKAAAPGQDAMLYDLTAARVLRSVEARNPAPEERLRQLSLHVAVAHRNLHEGLAS